MEKLELHEKDREAIRKAKEVIEERVVRRESTSPHVTSAANHHHYHRHRKLHPIASHL